MRAVKILTNFLLYDAVWSAAILGAAYDNCWLGVAAFAAAAVVHFSWITRNAPLDLITCAMGILIGMCADTAVAWTGALKFTHCTVAGPVNPPFMLALWGAFSLMMNDALAWLKGRYALGSTIGFVGGPLAYWGGAQLGAVALGDGVWRSLLIIGIEWAIVMPVFLYAIRCAETHVRHAQGGAR